jgi:hypothetical protein
MATSTQIPITYSLTTGVGSTGKVVYTNSGTVTFDTQPLRLTKPPSNWDRYKNLPVIENYDGPVYMNGKYYADIDEVLDALADDDKNPAFQIAHPCTETRAATPSVEEIIEYVEDRWAENFDEYEPMGLTHSIRIQVCDLVADLEAMAPVVWNADLTKRIALADEDLDQEYDPAEDTYE